MIMDQQEISAVKEALLSLCARSVDARIAEAERAIASAKSAAENETKSSAGDKYETAREMMRQEIGRNEAQLAAAGKLRYALQQLRADFTTQKTVRAGSLVFTRQGRFFISVSLGEMNVLGQTYFTVSPASPIGAKMMGKKSGEKIAFNGRSYDILSVH